MRSGADYFLIFFVRSGNRYKNPNFVQILPKKSKIYWDFLIFFWKIENLAEMLHFLKNYTLRSDNLIFFKNTERVNKRKCGISYKKWKKYFEFKRIFFFKNTESVQNVKKIKKIWILCKKVKNILNLNEIFFFKNVESVQNVKKIK